jgi:hypothetical protein
MRARPAFFERAREVAEKGGYEFAAWYVAGNIERLQILLGRAAIAVRAIRKRLEVLQAKGAKYDEIVTRSILAWALRLLGRHKEALHELDVALNLARETGTFNVLLEFLHYDRSIVLEALGDHPGARASYRRYARLVGKSGIAPRVAGVAGPGPAKRPLEPYFLKRADRFIVEQIATTISVARLRALRRGGARCRGVHGFSRRRPWRTRATCGSIRASCAGEAARRSPTWRRGSGFAARRRFRSSIAGPSGMQPSRTGAPGCNQPVIHVRLNRVSSGDHLAHSR